MRSSCPCHRSAGQFRARYLEALIFLGDVFRCQRSRAVDCSLADCCGRCLHGYSADPPSPAPTVRLVADGNPLAGAPFYVNPTSAAMRAAQSADPPSPELTAIANTPQAYWIVPGSFGRHGRQVHRRRAGRRRHPGAGAVRNPTPRLRQLRRGWLGDGRRLPRRGSTASLSGVGASRVAIIVEPDALAMADCLSGDQRQERFDLIRYAVDTLTRDPNAAVYVDAGHLRWHSPEDMAARLNQAGVGHARGFSVNTANFFTTEDEIGYGEAISGLTNGSHYVIDTSRNGAGPAPDSELNWCNPSGRALGTPPTANYRGRARRRLLVDQTSRRIRRIMRQRRSAGGHLREPVRHRSGPQGGPVVGASALHWRFTPTSGWRGCAVESAYPKALPSSERDSTG